MTKECISDHAQFDPHPILLFLSQHAIVIAYDCSESDDTAGWARCYILPDDYFESEWPDVSIMGDDANGLPIIDQRKPSYRVEVPNAFCPACLNSVSTPPRSWASGTVETYLSFLEVAGVPVLRPQPAPLTGEQLTLI